jgi:predicted DNA-binding transcriptional regulator YafY
MSKRGYISRYLMVLRKLKVKPYSSYEELKGYLENQLEYLQMQDDTLSISFSKRTLQRDIREISNTFGIDIEYSKTAKGYFISQSEMDNMNFQRMIEAFDMFNSLNLAQDLTPFINLEKRRPLGTENLYGLLHAIKNKFQIKFSYQKFWEDEISLRTVEPYALKEFKNRWYLLANDLKDYTIKSFALDRFSSLNITAKKFQFPADFDITEYFKHCFGIIRPNNTTPQEVILSFDPFQGKYIKSLPLHESQVIIQDNEDELLIRLTIYVTHDFIMEILSYGESVKVIKPDNLIDNLKTSYQDALNLY